MPFFLTGMSMCGLDPAHDAGFDSSAGHGAKVTYGANHWMSGPFIFGAGR